MMVLIGQMLGCLLVAAGIGGAVGWLLRHLSAAPIEQRLVDRETELRIKGQALDTALSELKVNKSMLTTLEAKVSSLESLGRSTQQELASRQDRIQTLHKELADLQQRRSLLESDYTASLHRLSEQETAMAAFANEARQANAARTAAQQDLLQKEQSAIELQQRLTELEDQQAEIDRLRAQVAELEPVQGRLHWMEVQLSEKETQHRAGLHRLEEQLASRDRRITELAEHEQALREKDLHIAELEQRLAEVHVLHSEIASQAKMMEEKEEEISRLRKRLVEVRAALRVRADGGHVVAGRTNSTNQLSLQIEQSKQAQKPQKDDLKKIHGIGPVIERTLNKLGTYTYVQIAKWTPSDIARIAQKLETLPDRIKRDHWIARARKLYKEKYGERI
jgi:predicted flap endonuclease-1-like 5' DNA nuclease